MFCAPSWNILAFLKMPEGRSYKMAWATRSNLHSHHHHCSHLSPALSNSAGYLQKCCTKGVCAQVAGGGRDWVGGEYQEERSTGSLLHASFWQQSLSLIIPSHTRLQDRTPLKMKKMQTPWLRSPTSVERRPTTSGSSLSSPLLTPRSNWCQKALIYKLESQRKKALRRFQGGDFFFNQHI